MPTRTAIISRTVITITVDLFSGPERTRFNEESFENHEDVNVKKNGYGHDRGFKLFAMNCQSSEKNSDY